MPRTRIEFDSDLVRSNQPTDYVTEANRFELPCGVCGRKLFVDRDTLEAFERSLEHDVDNQFVCVDCEQDYNDAAHGQ